jgi:hypothetical protein
MNTKRNRILEELEDIGSPMLASAKSMENIAGVPDAYFERLPYEVMHNLDKITAIDVPTGYFESLAPQILQKIDAIDAEKVSPIIDFQKYRRRERSNVVRYLARSGIAAAVLVTLLLSIRNLYFNTIDDPCDANDLACIEKQDIYDYLYENTVSVPILEEKSVSTILPQDSNNPIINTVNNNITPQEAQDILSPTEEEVLLDETINIF